MSYIVIARRWRPQNFDDLIGQESVVKTFKNAFSSNKIAHAYLFSGPRGVGKTSTARILAKALNCTERKESEPCGECSSCKAITESASVDVIEIDGASNNSVEDVRNLRETAQYSPSGGKYKIYIIDEVHMLSTPAFNALLKTLEEPPPHVIFIFATTEARKIPATILSRCQHHSFRRINKSKIREQLKKIAGSEKINISGTALEMIAKAADGSMRDGLTLLDQACSFTNDITENELQSLLGLSETGIILNLSKTILTGNISETFSIIKELTDRGSDLRQIARELVEYFRNIAILKVTKDAEDLLEFTEEESKVLRDMSADMSIEQLTLLLTELLKLEAEVRNSINPRYTLELGLLRTSFVKGMTSVEELLKMISGSGGITTAPKPSPVISDAPASPPAASQKKTAEADPPGPITHPAGPDVPVDLNKDDIWQKLVKAVDADDHLLAYKLAEAKPVNLTKAELSIGFNGGMSVLAAFIEKNISVIQPILKKVSGHDLRLKILSLPNEKNGKDIKDIKKEVFEEPVVRRAMEMFNGALLNVKPLDDK